MQKRAALVFLIAAAMLIMAEAAEDWRVEAGPVEIMHTISPQVTGAFYVHAPPGTSADTVARTGGACLLADLVPFGVGLATCKTSEDCNTPEAIDKANDPAKELFYGYCAVRDGSGEPPKCWTRPGPPGEYCLRSLDGLRLTPGTHQLPEVLADPLNLGEPLPDWAVFACIAAEGQAAGCASQVEEHRQVSLTPLPADGK